MQDEERNNLFRETKREQPAESNIVFPETSRISLQIPSSSIYIYIYIRGNRQRLLTVLLLRKE